MISTEFSLFSFIRTQIFYTSKLLLCLSEQLFISFLLKIEYDGTRVDEDGEERDSLSESNRLKTDVREKKINLVFSKLS